jgi:hypothetical protein
MRLLCLYCAAVGQVKRQITAGRVAQYRQFIYITAVAGRIGTKPAKRAGDILCRFMPTGVGVTDADNAANTTC